MTLYSYIVVYDTGFAPNPFFGYCTLACCKPEIRKRAVKGDWIVGLTPRARGTRKKIIYFMQVEESLSFDQYWKDRRFTQKRPDVNAGMTRRQGDNIYEPLLSGGYRQLPSAHSKPQFKEGEDPDTMRRDTIRGERVLVSTTFAYFGSEPKDLPSELSALIAGRGHKCQFLPEVKEAFIHFVNRQRNFGIIARPGDWHGDDHSWKSAACGKR